MHSRWCVSQNTYVYARARTPMGASLGLFTLQICSLPRTLLATLHCGTNNVPSATGFLVVLTSVEQLSWKNQLIDTSIWYYTLRPENSSSYLFFEGVIHYRFKQYRKRTLRRTNQSFLAGPNGPGRRNCGRGRDLMSSISCGVATQVETVEAAGAGKWKCVILEEPNVPKWTALYRK